MSLKLVDLLSPPITLYSNGELCHSSSFSGILTIFAYSILIAMSFYFTLNLIQRENHPSAFYFNRYVDDAGFFPLNYKSMFNFVQILDTGTNAPTPIDFNSFRIIGLRLQIELYTASDRDLSKMEHWLYGNCNNESDTIGIGHLITMDYFTGSACIRKYYNKDEKKYYSTDEQGFIWPSLDKGCSHPDRTFYGIIVERCRNDSLKSDCKSNEEIENYALTRAVGFQILDHYADVYNYQEPLRKYFYNVQNGIFEGSYTTNHLNFNPVTVKTFNGLIFDNKIEELSYYFEQNEKVTTNWETEDEGIYVSFYFWMQNRMQYYERSYEKIQDVFVDIGGMCNSILFLAAALNKLVCKYFTILDTENILIKADHKIANSIHNTENNNNTEDIKKKVIPFDNTLNEKNSENVITNIKKYDYNSSNNTDKNDKYNQSSAMKNIITNNYLMGNENNLVKIINKEKEIKKQNILSIKKTKTFHPIKKIPFNFFNYLSYIMCNKKNKILIYEEFRKKVLSEEYMIQNYLDVYGLKSICESQDEIIKIKGKYRMSRILSSAEKNFDFKM